MYHVEIKDVDIQDICIKDINYTKLDAVNIWTVVLIRCQKCRIKLSTCKSLHFTYRGMRYCYMNDKGFYLIEYSL